MMKCPKRFDQDYRSERIFECLGISDRNASTVNAWGDAVHGLGKVVAARSVYGEGDSDRCGFLLPLISVYRNDFSMHTLARFHSIKT